MFKTIKMLLDFSERKREETKENPYVKNGMVLFTVGIGLIAGGYIFSLKLSIPSIQLYLNIDTSIGKLITIFGLVVTITGIAITLYGLYCERNKWTEKIFYYLKGLDNQTSDPPFHALPKMAFLYHKNPIMLIVKNDNLDIMFDDFMLVKKNIEDKVEQFRSKDIFFAGLARIPCLFFIGHSFRTAHSGSITLIEHNHQNDSWFRFDKTDDPDIDVIIEYDFSNVDESISDIAITIEFTSEIIKQELPCHLQKNIVRMKTSKEHTHNLIKSSIALERVVEKIINQLIILSKKCNILHLFVSAQSSLVFELGRRYQDGMIGNIIIYNYEPSKKGYPWAISLENKEIKLEKY